MGESSVAGVDCLGLGGLALAKDLKMSPTEAPFLEVLLLVESERWRVAFGAAVVGAAGVMDGWAFAMGFATGFAAGFAAGLEVDLDTTALVLGVRRCGLGLESSVILSSSPVEIMASYLDVWVVYAPVYLPALKWIVLCEFGRNFFVAER